MEVQGHLLKMEASLVGWDPEGTAHYQLPIGQSYIDMNALIGHELSLEWTGDIRCIATGKNIKKSFNQGYSFDAFRTLARCDLCIMRPELCHYHLGTCREPKWGEENCMSPHIVYLAQSSHLKVGITRRSQIPRRWIDQGASRGLGVLEVPSRRASGMIESKAKEIFSDRTHWQKMLRSEEDNQTVDLEEAKEKLLTLSAPLIKEWKALVLETSVTEIKYPVLDFPQKIKSWNWDKNPLLEDKLMGIKGQYLIFSQAVINMRKYQGYECILRT